MFNIPWYSWLNILALPILLGIMYFESVLEEEPGWLKQLLVFHYIALFVVIVLYWNPQLFQMLVPANYLLALLILPYALWQIVQGLIGLTDALKHRKSRLHPAKNRAGHDDHQPASPAPWPLEGDDLDLDEGVTCASLAEQQARTTESISGLFSKNNSTKSKINNALFLLGEPDIDTPHEHDASFHVIGLLVYCLFAMPGAFMSIQLLSR